VAAFVTIVKPHPTLRTTQIMHRVYTNGCTCTGDFVERLDALLSERKQGHALVTYLNFVPTNHRTREIRDDRPTS